MIRSSLFVLLLIFNAMAHALIQSEAVPGGVVIIPVPLSSHINPPAVYYQQNRVTVIARDQQWHAVVGIPLGQALGEQSLTVESEGRRVNVPFTIGDKAYRAEEISVAQKYVTPPKNVLNRIQDEAKHLNWVLSQWHDEPVDITLIPPVKGRVSSEFGVHRILNGQPRSFHKGTDFAAPSGTPIQAAQKGMVVEVGNYYFTGLTVVIDHGQTFKTIYCHLRQIDVEKSQAVAQGELIGQVGSTGRASGPHLHFGVSLNNARVSPELFFDAL